MQQQSSLGNSKKKFINSKKYFSLPRNVDIFLLQQQQLIHPNRKFSKPKILIQKFILIKQQEIYFNLILEYLPSSWKYNRYKEPSILENILQVDSRISSIILEV
jgi:hypothetical protein